MNVQSRTARLFSLISLSVVCLLAGSTAWAADPFEQSQSGSFRKGLNLEGCYAEDFARGVNATDGSLETYYLACNSANGIFASTDNGVSWSAVSSATADYGAVIAVVAADTPGTAFMIGGIKLYRTTDDGLTWEQVGVDEDLNNFGQQMAFGNGTLMAPYRAGGMIVSTDDGVTLTNYDISTSGMVATYVAYSAADGAWYALAGSDSASQTLYVSADNGQTWIATAKTGDYSVVAIDPLDSNYLVVVGSSEMEYTSTGVAGTWINMNATNPSHVKSVVINSGMVIAGVEYTTDNGTTWESFNSTEALLKGNFFSVDGSTYYTQSGRGLAISEDGGTTWTDHYTGLNGVNISDVSITDDKETVWLAAYGGFVKSENFTSSITAGITPTWSDFIQPTEGIDGTSAVWVKPNDQNVVLATMTSLYKSTDSGDSWSTISTGTSGETLSDFAYDADSGTLYLGYKQEEGTVGGGVLMSTDFGDTWTDLGMTSAPVNAVTFDAADNILLAAVGSEQSSTKEQRGMYVYDGTTWTHLGDNSSEPLFKKLVSDVLYAPVTGYAYAAVADIGTDSGFHGGLFMSHDGANSWATWTQMTDGLAEDMWGISLAAETNGQSIYVASARPAGTAYIYKCVYDGSSCGTYYTGLVDENLNGMLFDDFVTVGTGMYRYKSKATLKLKNMGIKNEKFSLRSTLKDATTGQVVKGQKLKLYRKKNGVYVRVKKNVVTKTNSNGRLVFHVSKAGTYQVRWTPQKTQMIAAYKHLTKSTKLVVQ